jgi:hypothetical protein
MTDAPPSSEAPQPVREISGRLVVIGMLLTGLVATGVIFVYWELHTRPFRPLTEAIGRTFEHSLPKVEGGRHKGGPMTLRISLRVPFSPEADDAAAQEALRTLFRLIREHQNLSSYGRVEIHLFQMVPEETAKSKKFEFTPAEISRD